MFILRNLGLLIIALLPLVAADSSFPASPFPFSASIDGPSGPAQVSVGILLKHGKKTSCFLGLIDNQASFVNTNCFDLNKDGKVDDPSSYEVLVSTYFHFGPDRFTVEDVTIHPKYDPKTKANNIAVLQYNSGAGKSERWGMYYPTSSKDWPELVYAAGDLGWYQTNGNSAWNSVFWTSTSADFNQNDSLCKEMSPLFNTNQDTMSCQQRLTHTKRSDLTDCFIPYSSVYVNVNGGNFLTGLYSHSVVNGSQGLCETQDFVVRNYYTLLEKYLGFASGITGRTIPIKMIGDSYTPAPANFAQKVPSKGLPKGDTLVANDYYAKQDSSYHGIPSASDSETAGKPDGETTSTFDGGAQGMVGSSIAIILSIWFSICF